MERAAAARPHAPLHTGFCPPPVCRCAGRLKLAQEGEAAGPATQSSRKEGERGSLRTPKTDPANRSSSPTRQEHLLGKIVAVRAV